MARHDLDEDTLRILINDDAVLPMLREAFEDGTLQITVNNSYAQDKQETAVELYYKQPTLINFEDVIAETLTADEKYAVLTGTPVSFNIDISENTAFFSMYPQVAVALEFRLRHEGLAGNKVRP